MINIKIVILGFLFFLNLNIAQIFAQDVVFTQWENMSIHANPSLTGNFEGSLRIRTKYRNQWASIFVNSAYRTSAASFEYKFNEGSNRKISIGAHTILDKAGQVFSSNSFNFSTSVSQSLGDIKAAHHTISLGFNLGASTKKIDLDNSRWPSGMVPDDVISSNNYLDISMGLNWQYISKTRFRIQLGSGIFHINRPNISLIENGTVNLNYRYTIHGNAEIPLVAKFYLKPSFLYFKQNLHSQILFGIASKIYVKSNKINFFQIGIHAKTTQNTYGTDINIFVLSTMIEVNSILFGFSFDRFQGIESNAYEFTLGYILGK